MVFPRLMMTGGLDVYLLKGEFDEYSPPYDPYWFQILSEEY